MEYLLVKGKTDLFGANSTLGKYFDPQTGKIDRSSFATEIFQNSYQGYFDPELGRYLGLKSLSIDEISVSPNSLSTLILKLNYEAYFLRLNQRSIVDASVKSLSPMGVSAELLGYNIDIAGEDLVAGAKPEYDSTAKTIVFPSGNLKPIKEGDILRVKLTNLIKTISSNLGVRYRLRGVCKVSGCGKKD